MASEDLQNITSPPRKPRRTRQLSSTQVMFAVILAIALMLAVQFSSRIAEERNLATIQESVQDEIEALRLEQAELIDELNYVQNDAYVEEWARSEGRMVRENMVLVIPIPSNTTMEQAAQEEAFIPPVAPIQTTLPEPDAWELWWALFFDFEPPQLGS